MLVGATALTGCKKDKKEVAKDDEGMTTQHEYDPNKGTKVDESPAWELPKDFEWDPRSSMTLTTIIQGLSAGVEQGDKIAAFINGECRGVVTPEFMDDKLDPYFFLLVSLSTDDTEEMSDLTITLKYYSGMAKKVYTATETIPYKADAIMGSYEEPFAPQWK